MKRKVALISEDASPFTVLDTMDRRGHNIYVAEVAQHLARLGYLVDVFTRKDSQELPDLYNWLDNLRVIHVPVGPLGPGREEDLSGSMKDFTEYLIEFFSRQEKPYDLVHANFWRSGWAAAEIKANIGIPFVITFHTLGRIGQRQHHSSEILAEQRFEIENRVVRAADGIITRRPQDRQDLISFYNADPTYIVQISDGFDPAQVLAVNQGEAWQDEDLNDASRLHQPFSAWQGPTSLLADFYENVLAVRRVTIPQLETMSRLGYDQNQISPGNTAHALETVTERLGEHLLGAAHSMSECLERGGKVMICGDGTNTTLARHFTVELARRLVSSEYAGLPVRMLTVNEDSLTGQTSEISYGSALARQVETLGSAGDLLIGIASNNPVALLEAFQCARSNTIQCLSVTDSQRSDLLSLSDVALRIPASAPQQLQELQLLILHLLCELVQVRIPVQSQMLGDDLHAILLQERLVE